MKAKPATMWAAILNVRGREKPIIATLRTLKKSARDYYRVRFCVSESDYKNHIATGRVRFARVRIEEI
jgi:hypothetical protein